MHVVVVGGGITGLVVARELLRRGHQVTLVERDLIGGLAAGFPYPANPTVYLERFYHHLFRSDKLVGQLIWEEGLEHALVWQPTLSGIVAEGKPWPLRGPVDLLRCRPIGSIVDRLLLGWTLFRLKLVRRWEVLDGITCREFFTRHGAARGYRRMWLPLLEAKFARFAEEASAAFLWGRVVPRASSRRKGQECLGYLRGGFQKLFSRMAESLKQGGCRILLGRSVTALQPGRPCYLSVDGESLTCDRIVWTASLSLLAKLVPQITGVAPRQILPVVPYVAVTILLLAMRRSQSPFYWLNNIDPDISFGAVIEHTRLASPDDYGGEHILYVVNYHEQDDPRFVGKTPQELLELHEKSLQRIFGRFCREDICRMYVCQASFASPVYRVGFARTMPPYQGILPGVDVCNMAQVYPYDRNMNHCVYNALEYVKKCYPPESEGSCV